MKKQKAFLVGKYFRLIKTQPDIISIQEKKTGVSYAHLPYISGSDWASNNLDIIKTVYLSLEFTFKGRS